MKGGLLNGGGGVVAAAAAAAATDAAATGSRAPPLGTRFLLSQGFFPLSLGEIIKREAGRPWRRARTPLLPPPSHQREAVVQISIFHLQRGSSHVHIAAGGEPVYAPFKPFLMSPS